jgi:geranylgeranylglycerol-phosphate geranylgeranyltransferase
MKQLLIFLKIIRIQNSLIAGTAVLLGYWLSRSELSLVSLLLLFISAVAATGFGNVINDIRDIKSDTISHPDRPLPRGELTISGAWTYCLILIITSIICSFNISKTHGFATLFPLILLSIYSYFLKGTPLVGNLVVATLVAYSVLYGALGAIGFTTLIIPAILAFLLNFSREIIKDVQDEAGDRAALVTTSASLSVTLLRTLIYMCTAVYLGLLFLPYLRDDFGKTYTILCVALILPLHGYRTYLILSNNWKVRLSRISLLFKIEMICGLLAIAVDRLIG